MDYYAILGVDRTDTAARIKKAYHKLALKKQPDKGGSKEDFQKVTT